MTAPVPLQYHVVRTDLFGQGIELHPYPIGDGGHHLVPGSGFLFPEAEIGLGRQEPVLTDELVPLREPDRWRGGTASHECI